jgi:hypothetical protein
MKLKLVIVAFVGALLGGCGGGEPTGGVGHGFGAPPAKVQSALKLNNGTIVDNGGDDVTGGYTLTLSMPAIPGDIPAEGWWTGANVNLTYPRHPLQTSEPATFSMWIYSAVSNQWFWMTDSTTSKWRAYGTAGQELDAGFTDPDGTTWAVDCYPTYVVNHQWIDATCDIWETLANRDWTQSSGNTLSR